MFSDNEIHNFVGKLRETYSNPILIIESDPVKQGTELSLKMFLFFSFTFIKLLITTTFFFFSKAK